MNNLTTDEEGMLIGELARRANVSVRTIRFYIAEGLLPAPQTRGRFTSYDEDALLRLQAIRYFKEAFLPLREIRDRLEGLTTAEVRALLEELGQFVNNAPREKRSTAVDYIDQLVAKKAGPPRQMAEPNRAYRATQPGMPVPPVIKPTRPPRPETWRHFHIAPGISIQASSGLDADNEKRLDELLQFASRLFSSNGVKNA